MSKKDVMAEALKVLVDGGIEDIVTEKLRNEIAALEREEADELVVEYYEHMRADLHEDWYELEGETQQEWRNLYNKNRQYFTAKPEVGPLTVGDFAEMDQHRDVVFKDVDGDVWDYKHGSWGYSREGQERSTGTRWLSFRSIYPMTEVV